MVEASSTYIMIDLHFPTFDRLDVTVGLIEKNLLRETSTEVLSKVPSDAVQVEILGQIPTDQIKRRAILSTLSKSDVLLVLSCPEAKRLK